MPRILVVDDDALARAVVSDAVRGLGYEVVTAPGGGQALLLFEDFEFDLVLSDVRMPFVDGFDVARAIAASPRPAPVVLISGVRDVDLVAESARRGVQVAGILGKPVAAEPLGRVLERWCGSQLPISEAPGDTWSGEEFLRSVDGPVERFPPVRALFLAHRILATGQLSWERGGQSARVWVRGGKVVHVSGIPRLLGSAGAGLRDHQDLAQDLGAAVAAGLPADGLIRAASVGLGDALVGLIGQEGGTVRWESSTASRPGAFPLPVTVPWLIAGSVRRMRTDEVLEATWGRREYLGVGGRPPDDSMEGRWGLDPGALRLLRLAGSEKTFGQLLRKAVGAEPARRADALRGIDHLYLLGLLRFDAAAIGMIRLGSGVAAPVALPGQVEAIRAALRDMEGKRPSELLGLTGAGKLTPEVVAAAWREESRRFHPDQFYSAAPELRTLVEACFASLNQAYETLRNPVQVLEEERFRDARVKGIRFISEQDRSAARLAFRRGEGLYRAREWREADPWLEEAARLDPATWPHVLLATQVGWLSRRLSPEVALQELATLRPDRADRAADLEVAMAMVLKVLGRLPEALARYRAALEKFPENRDAQREVRLHGMREAGANANAGSTLAGLLARKKPETA